MFTRRRFAATAAAALLATPALAAPRVVRLPRRFYPQDVNVNRDLPAGQIHVVKQDFFLYWTLGNGRARRYGIALGEDGRNYTGVLTSTGRCSLKQSGSNFPLAVCGWPTNT